MYSHQKHIFQMPRACSTTMRALWCAVTHFLNHREDICLPLINTLQQTDHSLPSDTLPILPRGRHHMATLRQLGNRICKGSLGDEYHQFIYFCECFTAVVAGFQEAVSVHRNEHSIHFQSSTSGTFHRF